MNILEDRTVNIVLLTKRFGMNDVKKAIAQYMSEECGCPIEVYSDSILYDIVKTAMYDILRCSSNVSYTIAFIREMIETRQSTMLDRFLYSMAMMQVAIRKNDGELVCINGWHDTEFSKKLDADAWTMKWNK